MRYSGEDGFHLYMASWNEIFWRGDARRTMFDERPLSSRMARVRGKHSKQLYAEALMT